MAIHTSSPSPPYPIPSPLSPTGLFEGFPNGEHVIDCVPAVGCLSVQSRVLWDWPTLPARLATLWRFSSRQC